MPEQRLHDQTLHGQDDGHRRHPPQDGLRPGSRGEFERELISFGARVVKIGDVEVGQAAKSVRGIIAADNELDRENGMRIFFVWAEVLQAS